MLSDLRFRLRALFLRSRVEAELDEELEAHLDYEAEKYIRSGMSAVEARRKARIALGGVEQTRQQVRDSRGTQVLENFLQDLRYGTRSLLKNKGFATVVVLTLALGIAVCTAVFSLMDVVLYPKLPYADTDKLVYLYTPNPQLSQVPAEALPLSNAFFQRMRKNSHSFASMTQFRQVRLKLADNDGDFSIDGAQVDAGFFTTLSTKPILGRFLDASDWKQTDAAVISYALWQQRYGGDPLVLGKRIGLKVALMLPGVPAASTRSSYHIVGVMPPGFRFPKKEEVDYGDSHIDNTDIWTPLTLTPTELTRYFPDTEVAMARLRPGVSTEQAQAEMSTEVAQMNRLQPAKDWISGDWKAYVKPFRETLSGDARPLLHLLMGSVVLVLLVACGNSATLLLARNASRTHELGVRAMLGAGRLRLIQQMLTDVLLLGFTSGFAGIALAWLFLKALLKLDPRNIPRLQQAALHPPVLLFTVLLTLVTSLLTGILPALVSSRGDLIAFLKAGGNRGAIGSNHRFRSALVTAEVALVVILLAGAGLLVRSFLKVEAVSKGFSTATLSMKVELPPAYFSSHRAFFPRLLEGIRAIPGIQNAGAISSLPLSYSESVTTFWVEGYVNGTGQSADSASVTPDYFVAMGTPIIAGREFQPTDGSVVLVNQAFVRKYFGGHNPIGKWVRENSQTDIQQPGKGASTIIGVVADVRHSSLEQLPPPTLYDRLQDPDSAFLAIRSTLPPAEIVPEVRAALNRMDPTLTLTDIETMNDRVSGALALRRFQTVLLGVFSVMALVLALVGLYGLLAYTVRQREQEIGIRLAIGASRTNVLSLIVGQGVRLVVFGLVAGIAGAFALQHLLKSFLYGVQGTDPLTFLLVPLLLLLTALGACALPGWRAANVDPANSLRYE